MTIGTHICYCICCLSIKIDTLVAWVWSGWLCVAILFVVQCCIKELYFAPLASPVKLDFVFVLFVLGAGGGVVRLS